MKIFDLKTIYDYINGNDIAGYELEDLENDKKFMFHVLSITKDKNMYQMCSEELRNDLSFIENILPIFKTDEDFVYDVIKEYINNNIENDKGKLQACLLGLQYIKDEDIVFKLKTIANIVYVAISSEIKMAMLNIEDKEFLKSLGVGFIVAKETVEYELSTRFFAKKYIDQIFDDLGNLEVYLHETFKNGEMLKEYGVSKFIIDVIKYSDEDLADYVALNFEIVSDYKKKIDKIIRNWNAFEKRNTELRYTVLFESLIEHMCSPEKTLSIDYDLFLYSIFKKYGLERIMFEHDNSLSEAEYNDIMQRLNDGEIDRDELEFQEKVYEKELCEMVEEALKPKVFIEKDEYVESLAKENKPDALILQFRNNK